MSYFAEALQSDVSDIQQGTTAEGVHLGAMAGTVDLVQRVSTGIEVTGDVLRLNPQLPQEMERLDMRIRYRGHSLDLRLTRHALTVRGRERGAAPIHWASRTKCTNLLAAARVFSSSGVQAHDPLGHVPRSMRRTFTSRSVSPCTLLRVTSLLTPASSNTTVGWSSPLLEHYPVCITNVPSSTGLVKLSENR